MIPRIKNQDFGGYSTELLIQKADDNFNNGYFLDSAGLYELIINRIQLNREYYSTCKKAELCNMYGLTLKRSGYLMDALRYYQLAVGMEGSKINYRNNLAIVYMELGCYEESQALFQEILNGAKDGHDSAFYKLNYATMLVYKGHYDAAAVLFRESLSFFQKHELTWLEDLAHAYYRLGFLFSKIGCFRESLQLLMEALQSKITVWGSRHPRVAEVVRVIAETCLGDGDLEQAKHYAEQALHLYRGKIYENAPEYGRVFLLMGNILDRLDREGASDYLQNAETILHSAYKEHANNPDLARMHSFWGEFDLRKGDCLKALSRFQRAESIYQSRFALFPPAEAAEVHNNMGFCYMQQGNHVSARRHFRQSRRILKTINPYHPWLDVLVKNMRPLLEEKGHMKPAGLVSDDQVKRIRKKKISVRKSDLERNGDLYIHVLVACTGDQQKLAADLTNNLEVMAEYYKAEQLFISFQICENGMRKSLRRIRGRRFHKVIFAALYGNDIENRQCDSRKQVDVPCIINRQNRSCFEITSVLNIQQADVSFLYTFRDPVSRLHEFYKKECILFPDKHVFIKKCTAEKALREIKKDLNRQILFCKGIFRI